MMKARKRSKRKPTENSFDRIPKGLKKLLQWVLWKIITINGKRTKIPYNPKKRNQKAKVNDPSTWGSYEEAVEQSKEGCDGIGFVVTQADDYIFLDLDACREAVTGKIAEWAMVIVLLLNSYTEESPSGCGIRIVIKATFPPDEERAFRTIKPKVEETYGGRNPEIMVAQKSHYFTMTGRVIEGVSNQIEDRSDEFLQLYDEHFREKPVSNKPKSKGKKQSGRENEILSLLNNLTESHTDESTPDFALCCAAINRGWDKEAVWSAVCNKSKFKRRGRDYFDTTWNSAVEIVGADEDRQTQAQQLISCLVDLDEDYFHNPGENPDGYVTVNLDGKLENFLLKSASFEQLLRRLYFAKTGRSVNRASMDAAVSTLIAGAIFDGSEHEVAIRVARIGNAIFVDLADKKRRAIKITADGWEIVEDPPVKFIRVKGMLALPTPKRGGDINALRPFLNIANDDDWILLVSVIVQIFFPPGPFVILIATGEHGTAKSTLCKILIALTDPKTVPLFSAPRNLEDVYVAACNSHVLCIVPIFTLTVMRQCLENRNQFSGGIIIRNLRARGRYLAHPHSHVTLEDMEGLEETETTIHLFKRTLDLGNTLGNNCRFLTP